MLNRITALRLATALLYFGPLLAGLSGAGWAFIPIFVVLFVLWLLFLHPELSTSPEWLALLERAAVQALLVAILFGIGRGLGGVTGLPLPLPVWLTVIVQRGRDHPGSDHLQPRGPSRRPARERRPSGTSETPADFRSIPGRKPLEACHVRYARRRRNPTVASRSRPRSSPRDLIEEPRRAQECLDGQGHHPVSRGFSRHAGPQPDRQGAGLRAVGAAKRSTCAPSAKGATATSMTRRQAAARAWCCAPTWWTAPCRPPPRARRRTARSGRSSIFRRAESRSRRPWRSAGRRRRASPCSAAGSRAWTSA